jgi:hypothetical protein
VLVNQQGQKVTLVWFAESGQPVSVSNNEAIVNLNFIKEDAGSWKEPIVDPTLTDVEFNDAFAVTYLQPRINLPVLAKKSDVQVSVYPNPINENQKLNLNLSNQQSGSYTFQILDLSGRVVKVLTHNVLAATHTTVVELPGLAAGTYQLLWNFEGQGLTQSGTQKLTVVK